MTVLWLFIAAVFAIMSMGFLAVAVFWTDEWWIDYPDKTARPSEVKANVRG